jgi:two-component system invasion response regulator UvrY
MNKIQILIADNHKLSRENLSFVLNCDSRFQVMGECAIPEEAVEFAKSGNPDIILMSINEPAFSELEATQQIRNISPACGIIGISANPQPSFAKKIMQRGAKGYVTKNSSKDEIVRAILEVSQGNKYVCAEVKNIVTEQLFSDDQESAESGSLTKREIQIINFIKGGLSSKEIAGKLYISLRTVQAHRYNILKKLKLKNSASLVNFMNTKAAFI